MAKKVKLPARQNLGAGGRTEEKSEKTINEGVQDIFDMGGELVVDVFETGSDFVILTAIAGAQIKDLDISVEEEMMIIKGDRQNPHNKSEQRYFYQECYWGPFSKKIVLPENVDAESAQAEMDKGILTIRIPKKKQES
ncbi:MAG: hypothetical protein A3D35_01785 [Candidatus Staskawiczbacteria bacterium RIFCSPHIGHO2_02_FULL_34_9]|uniref:SHSP domain-containing protein n=1 Tax=Candidatus Staskawiczbacteria bacterium RIFCSPHIGHO2_02_FULL_34_9 TaxID=1802206 RepID=A0A1G2HX23_9BACT|nr:MAG: hypothetical protein A3D35_01785 [Candidatus Staskawiczbacteria bacterium RIFCSPHIGHO2_02_FULL_34_9]